MVDLVAEFRSATANRSNGKRSPGRYPNRAREIALRHLDEVRSIGGKASKAARELGIDANTLRVWDKKPDRPKPAAALLPVQVVEPAAPRPVSRVGYVVHGPGGLSVECGSIVDVAELFRALA